MNRISFRNEKKSPPRLGILSRFIAQCGLAALARGILARGGRFVLNFHGVSRQRHPDVPRDSQPHYTVDEFRSTLAWLAARFTFLSPADFLYSAKPGILLTFDDGHANNLTNILPLLAEFRAPGLFFISTQHLQNPRNWLGFTLESARAVWGAEQNVPEEFARDCYDGLSEMQLAELAASPWVTIGAHTVKHPRLSRSSPEQVRAEMEQSRAYLQCISGQPVHDFAYPYGDYNRLAAETAKNLGFRAAFVVNPLPVGLPAFEIPRVDVYYADPAYLALKLSGLRWPALHGAIL